MRGVIRTFLKDESGAVSADWVVLTAFVATLAVFLVPGIRTAMGDISAAAGELLTSYSEDLPDAPDL